MKCGEPLYSVPSMEAPAQPSPPVPSEAPPVPLQAPLPEGPRPDYRAHLLVGAILAFVATLVIPPLTGGLAMLLGYRVYARGNPDEKRRGLLVMLGGLVGTSIGLAIALVVQESGLLP
jgi:hypothetical protein